VTSPLSVWLNSAEIMKSLRIASHKRHKRESDTLGAKLPHFVFCLHSVRPVMDLCMKLFLFIVIFLLLLSPLGLAYKHEIFRFASKIKCSTVSENCSIIHVLLAFKSYL
jgi:hypothetical protein